MKITFITNQIKSAASEMYWNAMKSIPGIFLYKEGMDIRQFDVALIMTYEHYLVDQIRQLSPKTKIGIIDPRDYKVIDSAKKSDFLIVDSIEMEDYWRKANVPIFRYIEYPYFNYVQKKHEKKDKIIIGYNGNQIHLDCMKDNVIPAISELGEKYNLELLIMYNGIPPTGKESWWPKNVNVKFIQWGLDKFETELANADIGLAPNKMPFKEKPPYAHDIKNNYNYSPDDYILRFKMPTNPGRIIVFGKLGIPVISDFYPSAFELISYDKGFTCFSKENWKYRLEMLIKDSELRQRLSDNLQKYIKENLDFELQNEKFINFLNEAIL